MANEEGSELRKTVTSAASRIQEIIDAAENVAGDIRADAEAEAQTYLAERKREADRLVETRAAELSQVSSDMTRRSNEVQTKLDEFVAAVDHALAGVRSAAAEQAAPTPVVEPPAPRAAEPVAAPVEEDLPPLEKPLDEPTPISSKPTPSIPRPIAYPGKNAGAEGGASEPEAPSIAAAKQPRKDLSSEAALVRATQLAVAGRERAEIEAAIQDEFQIDDPTPVVDQILGRAS